MERSLMPAGDAAVELAVCFMVSSRCRGERAPFGDGLLGVLAGVAAT